MNIGEESKQGSPSSDDTLVSNIATEQSAPMEIDTQDDSLDKIDSKTGIDDSNMKASDDFKENSDKQPKDLILGGKIMKRAYALLTGKFKDTKESTVTTLSVPLTALPATLGRNSTNEHTFELGNCKQLSRKHAVIFFTDKYGGRIGKPASPEDKDIQIDGEWVYSPPPKLQERSSNNQKKEDDSTKIDFHFAITCLSKNKIIVDGERVEQGQTTALKHGSTIKLLTFTLYFLLPNVESKLATIPFDNDDSENESSGPAQKRQKKEKDDNQLDESNLPALISEFINAVETDSFERKHSMISTSILQFAVHDAAKDPTLRSQSDKEGGVSRTVLMEWIASNDVYKKYVDALLTKLEMKSYQQNLSRSLIKAGYMRLGTTGRHIKWLLPKCDAPIVERKKSKESVTEKKSTGEVKKIHTTVEKEPIISLESSSKRATEVSTENEVENAENEVENKSELVTQEENKNELVTQEERKECDDQSQNSNPITVDRVDDRDKLEISKVTRKPSNDTSEEILIENTSL